jgi:hypothetical protein
VLAMLVVQAGLYGEPLPAPRVYAPARTDV